MEFDGLTVCIPDIIGLAQGILAKFKTLLNNWGKKSILCFYVVLSEESFTFMPTFILSITFSLSAFRAQTESFKQTQFLEGKSGND